jgi:hypothetical protein
VSIDGDQRANGAVLQLHDQVLANQAGATGDYDPLQACPISREIQWLAC